MKYGLPETTIQMIRGVFAYFPKIDTVVLYGSRAKGTYQAGSDIDLTLFGDELTPEGSLMHWMICCCHTP